MLKIGVSSKSFPLTGEAFAELAREGITALELAPTAKECESMSIAKIRDMARDSGMHICSYHLPFSPNSELDPSSDDREIRRRTVALYCKLIRRGADAGIRRFIIHPSCEPVSTDAAIRAVRLSIARDTLASLAEVAELSGAEIAVENLPRTCLGNTTSELELLVSGNEKLGVCFDTNHLLTDTNELFIERLGRKIKALHISDYDRINERHWLPGEGVINWHGLYLSLVEQGFDGVWLYETAPNPKTIIRSRPITAHDVAENAKAIFAGTPIPVFSHRIEGLGMWV